MIINRVKRSVAVAFAIFGPVYETSNYEVIKGILKDVPFGCEVWWSVADMGFWWVSLSTRLHFGSVCKLSSHSFGNLISFSNRVL